MTNSIVRATTTVLVMNLLAKILGFVREMFIAREFGANMFTDAYLVAYTLPYFLQTILGYALVTITVPILTKYLLAGDRTEAFKISNYFVNLVALLMVVLALLGVAIAPLLVKVTAPLFDQATAALATELTRIMLPSIIFMSAGMVVTGILNANHKFVFGSFAPGFSSLIIILTVVIVGSNFGIYGLAVGTLLSFVGFLLVQLPAVYRLGFRYRPALSLSHPEVRGALAVLVPIVLGTAVNQIYFAINRIFASGLAEGSISALNYASKLVNFPSGVFVAAIAAAIYPSFAEFAIKGEHEKVTSSLEKGIGVVMLLGIPAAVGLMVLRVPIVALLFEGGAFTHADTLNTAAALFYFSIGLFPFAAILVMTRVFYAFGDVKTPVWAGCVCIAINVAASILLIGPMTHSGLALANSLCGIVNMLIFFKVLRRYLPTINYRRFFESFCRITLAALVMAGAIILTLPYLSAAFAVLDSKAYLVIVLLEICGGIAVYIGTALLLRVREAGYVKELVRPKRKA